jgi:hypothetical protein
MDLKEFDSHSDLTFRCFADTLTDMRFRLSSFDPKPIFAKLLTFSPISIVSFRFSAESSCCGQSLLSTCRDICRSKVLPTENDLPAEFNC